MELHELNDTTELYHYGVLGMKWGVRRTPEQLGHKTSKKKKKTASFDELPSKAFKPAQEIVKGASKTTDIVRKKAEEKRKAQDAATISQQRKSAKDLTTKELQDLVNRMNLEDQYAKLSGQRMAKGKSFIEEMMEAVGEGLSVTTSILGIIMAMKQVKEMLGK